MSEQFLIENIRNISYKDWQRCFSFLAHPTLTNVIQRKTKTYHVNDLLALSVVNIIV